MKEILRKLIFLWKIDQKNLRVFCLAYVKEIMMRQDKLLMVFGLLTAPLSYLLADTASPGSPDTFLPSTLEDYLQRTHAKNPQLKAFEARYQAAMKRVPQASALPDPMFQVTEFVESVQTRTGPQKNVFMLSQKIPWFGKLSHRRKAASAEAEALRFALQNQQLLLTRKVSLAFYELGYIDQAIRLTEKNRKLLADLEPIVEEKVKAGGDINALLRLKVEIGKVTDKLASLDPKRVAQVAQLNALLALPPDHPLPFPKWELPENRNLDRESIARGLEEHNPELQMLKRKTTSAEVRRELARLNSYPDVTLGLNYIRIGEPSVNPLTPGAGKDDWGVTVGINIPLWFEKNRAIREEAASSERAARKDYANRSNTLYSELKTHLAAFDDANRRLKLYGEELLELAEQAVENSRTSYQGGRTGILEVIDSERSLLELELLNWRAAADIRQKQITIQSMVNHPIFKSVNDKRNDQE